MTFELTALPSILQKSVVDCVDPVASSRLLKVNRSLRAYFLKHGPLPGRLDELIITTDNASSSIAYGEGRRTRRMSKILVKVTRNGVSTHRCEFWSCEEDRSRMSSPLKLLTRVRHCKHLQIAFICDFSNSLSADLVALLPKQVRHLSKLDVFSYHPNMTRSIFETLSAKVYDELSLPVEVYTTDLANQLKPCATFNLYDANPLRFGLFEEVYPSIVIRLEDTLDGLLNSLEDYLNRARLRGAQLRLLLRHENAEQIPQIEQFLEGPGQMIRTEGSSSSNGPRKIIYESMFGQKSHGNGLKRVCRLQAFAGDSIELSIFYT